MSHIPPQNLDVVTTEKKAHLIITNFSHYNMILIWFFFFSDLAAVRFCTLHASQVHLEGL